MVTLTQSKKAVKRLWALRGALAILNEEEYTLTIIGPPKAFTGVDLHNSLDLGVDLAIERGPILSVERDGLLNLKWKLY